MKANSRITFIMDSEFTYFSIVPSMKPCGSTAKKKEEELATMRMETDSRGFISMIR